MSHNSMTVSFTCVDSNDAILLQTLFDILTLKDVDSSINAMYHTAFLVERIYDRLQELHDAEVEGIDTPLLFMDGNILCHLMSFSYHLQEDE